MTTSTATAPARGPMSWFRRAENWLDTQGKWAWFATLVLLFVLAWPLGLALLAYMIWGKRMFSRSCRSDGSHRNHRHEAGRDWAREWGHADRTAFRPTGNNAFDAYKADTLKRLEEEQDAFEAFLHRLRAAKDKTEFDSFMEDRAAEAKKPAAAPAPETAAMGADTARPGEY